MLLSVQHRSVTEILQATFEAADQFTTGAEQHHNMTLLLMKIEAIALKIEF
jgi:hypothetical protein